MADSRFALTQDSGDEVAAWPTGDKKAPLVVLEICGKRILLNRVELAALIAGLRTIEHETWMPQDS